jgi:hypothetical protein
VKITVDTLDEVKIMGLDSKTYEELTKSKVELARLEVEVRR